MPCPYPRRRYVLPKGSPFDTLGTNHFFQGQNNPVAPTPGCQKLTISHNKRPPNKPGLFKHHSDELVIR